MTTKKRAAKASKPSVRKPNALHERIIALMKKPTGADIHELGKAGWKYSAAAALAIAKRRGLKVNVVKKSGALARYVAKAGGA